MERQRECRNDSGRAERVRPVVVGLQPGHIQSAIATVTQARLVRDESVGANPEFCQGLQIALVGA
jgi:hypothetical protein